LRYENEDKELVKKFIRSKTWDLSDETLEKLFEGLSDYFEDETDERNWLNLGHTRSGYLYWYVVVGRPYADKEAVDHFRRAAEYRSLDDMGAFIKHIVTDYRHRDLRSVITTCFLTVYHAIDKFMMSQYDNEIVYKSDCGMFPVDLVVEDFVRWLEEETGEPMDLVKIGRMLYAQNEEHCDKKLHDDDFAWMQKEAEKHLKGGHGSKENKKHWQSIVDGKVPFGYTLWGDGKGNIHLPGGEK